MNGTISEAAPIVSAPETTLALLPAPLLHTAAQFTSRDAAKAVLQLVHVTPCDNGNIAIEATDGYRAFRCEFEPSRAFHCAEPLLLDAGALRKRCTNALWVAVRGETLDFLGGKTSRNASGVPCAFLESRPYGSPHASATFPNLRQLMPDKYSNAPGAPIAFNARYIGEFAAEVSRYSVNGCFTMETNGPATPLMFTAKADIIGTETVTLQYLLMPVRIRP